MTETPKVYFAPVKDIADTEKNSRLYETLWKAAGFSELFPAEGSVAEDR